MRVFLTGASGFIGANVTRTLLAAGCSVLALALPDDPFWRLQDVAGQITVLRGNLSDLPTLQPALAEWGPQACIHLAWYAEPGKYLHSSENLSFLVSSLALLEILTQIGCKQVVAAGTCAEYDTNWGYLREGDPTRPATLYAAAKLSFGLLGQLMAAAAGIRFAWARIFYPYGPYEDKRRVVPALIHALLNYQPFPATKGEQVRDYIHVEDVASAFWTLAEREGNGVFNIASGVPVTVRQLLETVEELVSRRGLIQFGALSYRDWEPMFICGDNQRLRNLGWSPRYTLREGIRQTVEWWRNLSP
jgi:nucleoside-diphosphate-sugar epimerase